jgi:hypothetical protein
MKRDTLSRLIARNFGLADVIQPVLPSRFEPISRIPFLNSTGLEPEEERRSAEPLLSGIRPATPKVHVSEPVTQTDLNDVVRPVPAPSHVSSRSTEPPFGSRPSAGSIKSVGRQPPDEKSAAGQPNPTMKFVTPAPVSRDRNTSRRPLVYSSLLPEPPERDEPAGRLARRGQVTRHIIPVKTRARQPEPAAQNPEATRGSGRREASEQEASRYQTVTVHIGRIEVRAVVAPAREPERNPPPDNRQRLTLADYLQQREKGAR